MSTYQPNLQSQIEARRQYRTSLWDIAPPANPLTTALSSTAAAASSQISARDQSGKRIYVGSISYELKEDDILKLFSTFGEIVKIEMPRDPVKGTTKGYCFIEFTTPESARVALESMNGFILNDRPIKVNLPTTMGGAPQPAVHTTHPSPACRVYVGSIDYSITEANIRELFSVFGVVRSVQLLYNPGTMTHKGYGFVEFESEAAAQQAMEKLNKFQLKDRQLIVAPASSRQANQSQQQMHQAAAAASMPMAPTMSTQFGLPTSVMTPATMTTQAAAPTMGATNIVRLQNMITADKYAQEDPVAFEDEVRDGCTDFGTIQQIKVIPRPSENKVDVFVIYSNANEATAALRALDKKKFDDALVSATFAHTVE